MDYKEESRSTQAKGCVETDDYSYDVDYYMGNGKLDRIYATVYKKTKVTIETESGKQDSIQKDKVGTMAYESGHKQVSVRSDLDIAPHAAVFNELITTLK